MALNRLSLGHSNKVVSKSNYENFEKCCGFVRSQLVFLIRFFMRSNELVIDDTQAFRIVS